MSQQDGEKWVRLIDSPFKCEGLGGQCEQKAQWKEYVISCDKMIHLLLAAQ